MEKKEIARKFLIIQVNNPGCDQWLERICRFIFEGGRTQEEKPEIKVRTWGEFENEAASSDDFDTIIFMSDRFEGEAILMQYRFPQKRVIFLSRKGGENERRTPEKINAAWGLEDKAWADILWAF